MISAFTLPVNNCSRLVPLENAGGGIVAACGSNSVHIISPQRGEELCNCAAPAEATTYTLWVPPGLTAKEVHLIYILNTNTHTAYQELRHSDKEDGVPLSLHGHFFLLTGSSTGAVPFMLEDKPMGYIEGLEVLYHTILAVITRVEVAFYYLNPELAGAEAAYANNQQAVTLKRVGPVLALAFPNGSNIHTQITADNVDAKAEPKRFAVIQTKGGSYVWACRLAIRDMLVVQENFTFPYNGVMLPPSCKLASLTVNWHKEELLALIHKREKDNKTAAILSLSLALEQGESTLRTWDNQAMALNAGAKTTLRTADFLCCTQKGEVWAIDKTTGPYVSLRLVSSPMLIEQLLQGSRASDRVVGVACGEAVYVLDGSCVYKVTSMTTSGGGSRSTVVCDTFLDWFKQQQLPLSGFLEDSRDVIALVERLTNVQGTEGDSGFQHVVRDFTYVVKDTTSLRHRHLIFEALKNRCAVQEKSEAVCVDYFNALLRYLSRAESIHPYTAFAALHHVDDAIALSIAVILAQKKNLRLGSLQHAPELIDAAEAFFSFDFQASIEKKRYLARVCETALSALAIGALGAVSILFCVADMGMRHTYGNHYRIETLPQTVDTELAAEVRKLERSIAEAIRVMSSYTEWAFNTSVTSLGVMSAHIGKPSNLKKEACVRDGRSHPIVISHPVQIEVFKPGRHNQQ